MRSVSGYRKVRRYRYRRLTIAGLGFNLLRPWGIISSIGVHNGHMPWASNEAYGKNLRLQMGRCPVRSKSLWNTANFGDFSDWWCQGLFENALRKLAQRQHQLEFLVANIVSSHCMDGWEF